MATPTSNTLPLADIHLQTAPGIWPLAWGWWLVIAATLAVIIMIVMWLRARAKKTRAQKEALQTLNTVTSLADMNALLKRAALSYFNREHVAGLTGAAWLRFLDAQCPDKHSRDKDGFLAHQDLWQKGIFSKEGLSDSELATCKALTENWLKHALPPKASHALPRASSHASTAKEENHV
ncbi:DUF4381 domain-containing protein [Enterovibrio norvegicus]|uniref:DUF4381 domain-containing protein n=1 Tax=Enterovibrio norvegicus TaxID=188144 RepID=A0A2N7L8L8_9GAMM|nr:DUF4381 domain-containing protein [Enterovibrio norvegicus]PMN90581.1 hypothetical protein BCT23_19375 [Enterovibrio norvegicus]